jgi:microcystin-dependent protein
MQFLKKFSGEILRLVIFAAVLGTVGASGQMWKWSQTAGTNANADPHINYSEGMAPSAVNDSARAMMAELAKFRDDISGLLTTGGSSTAYTVATNQVLAATPNDGQILAITVHATNGAAATLQADGGTAYPIQSSAGVAVASGTLILGSPYSMRFSVANSAWMLRGFYASATNVPLGAMTAYTGGSSPNSNFVLAQGQCISTTTYASYWVLMGSPASGSCAGGQFRVIDMQGRVPAGVDLTGTRLTSSAAGCGTNFSTVGATCANGSESHTLTIAELAAHSHTATDSGHQHATASGTVYGGTSTGGFTTGPTTAPAGTVNLQASVSTGFASASITVANAGGGSAHAIVQPTIAVNYLLRVL